MTTIKRDCHSLADTNRAFSWPCTETDLLYLNAIFTTKGIHHIRAADELSGRLLIQNVLASLQWYYQIACVAATEEMIIAYADNIITKLSHPYSDGMMEQFFLEEFYYDFVWIEMTEDLKQQAWIESFQEHLSFFQIDRIIPIIIIEYQK